MFSPVASDDLSPNLGSLGGLASLAGVSLPSSSSSDFLTFKYLLKSEEVAAVILEHSDLVQEIFSHEWDAKQISSENHQKGNSLYLAALKHYFSGRSEPDYTLPNAARLSEWMKSAFIAVEDRETGFLTLSSETSKPKMLIKLMALVTKQTDLLLKERYRKCRRNHGVLSTAAIEGTLKRT